jgi:hypothetical protein
MDGLTYHIEERDGLTFAVGSWEPTEGNAVNFEMRITDEAEIEPRLIRLQQLLGVSPNDEDGGE